MQIKENIVAKHINIIALNPNSLSDDISHKNPANIPYIALSITFSYIETATINGTIKTGFISKISNKFGVVCHEYTINNIK